MNIVQHGQKVVSNDQMRQLDYRTIREYKVPGLLLMERASLEVFSTCIELIRKHNLEEVVIFVGPGNNGGDGLAVARHLEAEGMDVKVILLAQPESLRGDALENYHLLNCRKVMMVHKIEELITILVVEMDKRLIIDALFGTGIQRPIEGEYIEAIRWINAQTSKILAIDIPSGVHGDTGNVLGEAVMATDTVAFQLPKVGNVSYPGAAYNGKLKVASIGIPRELINESDAVATLPNMELLSQWLPQRPVNAHKGTCGSLLIIGGVEGYSGAGVLAAMAAQRSGVGLVKTAVRKSVNQVYEKLLPEVVTMPIEESEHNGDGYRLLTEEGLDKIQSLAESAMAVVAGPGWGLHTEWVNVLKRLIILDNKPLLLDADALTLLQPNLNWLKQRNLPAVLTPHPGEMSRLTGLSISEINNNRLEITAKAAIKWNAVVLLKGAGTIIASPKGDAMINTTGNPGMATAGSGDVLAGIIGALLAQGLAPFEAAVLGCWVHGRAGDLAAEEVGEISLIASEIIKYIPQVLKTLYDREKKHDEITL